MSVNENLVKNASAKSVMSRIALKIDTWNNWKDTTEAGKKGRLILHAGEVAFVQMGTVPPMPGETNYVDGVSEVLFKVGDGINEFKDLPWGSAKAADVYDWAKVSSANIVEISYGSGASEKKSTLSAFLEAFETYKTSNDEAIADINEDLGTLSGKVEILEGLVGGDTTNFATKSEVTKAVSDAKTELIGTGDGTATTIKGASAQAAAAQTAADEAKASAKTANDWIDAHKNVTHITVSQMNTAIANADNTLESKLKGSSDSSTVATTIAQASDKAEAAQTTANEAKTKAETNADEIAELKTKDTNLETRVAALEADDTTKTYVDTELAKKVNVSDYNTKMHAIDEKDSDQDSKLSTLIGQDTNMSARAIAAEETAKIVAGADTAYDTLKEVADWIKSDTTGAAKMNSDILANAAAIQTLNGNASTPGSVAKAVADEATARSEAITNAVNALDMDELSVGAGETIKTVKQADGKVSATKQTISITKSQISDFKDSDYAAASAFNNHVTDYNQHVTKAVTTDTYLLIDCGTSTINID